MRIITAPVSTANAVSQRGVLQELALRVETGTSPSSRPREEPRRAASLRESSCNLIFFLLMSPILTSVLLGLTAAAANVFGGAIIVQKHWERSYLRYFVALVAGFMLLTALVEMVPESLELRGKSAAFLVLLGYLIIHFFEHTVTPHFHFGEETHRDEFMHSHKGYSVLLGLIIHTFFDGIAIASGFLVSNWLGWLIFLAIFLHKIPEGFTVSSVMLASGRSRGTAWGASVVLGGSTLAGVLTMALFRHHV